MNYKNAGKRSYRVTEGRDKEPGSVIKYINEKLTSKGNECPKRPL